MTKDPAARFGGIARLYGQAAFDRLQASRVAVIGIGGVGSWTVEALARSGVGHLALVDLDELCITNTNRQLHATQPDLGRAKVAVMAERVRTINPEAEVEEIAEFYSERSSERILGRSFDLVVDAIDTIAPKVHLLAHCHRRGIPVVCSGGAGGRRDPTRVRSADLAHTHGDALLGQVRKRLRSGHGFPTGDGKAPPFGIPAVFSPENPVYPQCDGSTSPTRPDDLPGGIRCDAGFGTAAAVTGTFGFVLASLAVEQLVSAG